jgi:nitroimidazol reductase NimA-like FMN-containing flavoprotein (pyridoxamine 5'-phosphate oxidase superfamily)
MGHSPGIPAEAEELLAGAAVSAHLATSVDDRPHVAPVWFDYRDGVVSILTGGRKLANLRENPRVALSVERADGPDVEWAITIRGTARVVDDLERKQAAATRVFRKYDDPDYEVDGDPGGTLVEVRVGSVTVDRYD